ncbi:APC family permease [Clostridium felsineum]|uniref:Potassium transporter KimA n=1 Tax=Clostridium felsineum TaxID=36839 RepID=A0A1S8LCA2_9CLOT|nr:APC family permease [Clostridium felsineum]MCR3761721.1 APC family permease [Clostridium felsineum]URZ02449.1 Potassium transporter KimA [Clostridium felsineum]URZ04812.1 Potassium transporter KimA [Clostridium felsineum]URZ09853.1 Potassium transporter KimA [Clostridium felsineum]URZ18239.1 Potassium transporter KimA [Clostridium felsineum DSM 794]
MVNKFFDLLIGRPLANEQSSREKYNVPFGLAIMASDAISSVAYASQEILLVLVPAIGLLSYKWLGNISLMIIGLLFILTVSYVQIIKAYPQGGGAYVVAKENLGIKPGLVAGAALLLDYILTVAVSSSSGVAAITSAFPVLVPHKVLLAVVLIAILTILNLRGVSESAKVFSVPTYLFIFSMIFMIIFGLVKYAIYGPSSSMQMIHQNLKPMGEISIFLILKAFSSGCSALTGLEAVSNSVPNFKEPGQKNATIVMVLLTFAILFIFGGSSLLARFYNAVPNPNVTVLAQIAYGVFSGKTFMFYVIQFTTAIILIMACNTSYTGFPMLMSVIARDGYAPRSFATKGKRLSFSNGILFLSIIAAILVVIFKADTDLLIPLYSVGVFLSFTLAQTGMVIHWNKTNEKGKNFRRAINGFGAFITLITTCVIVYEKFLLGAWVIILLVPIIVLGFLHIKKHYNYVARGLRADEDYVKNCGIGQSYNHLIIVPIASLNKATLGALKYARSITSDVIALNVSPNKEYMDKLKIKWEELNTDILLVSKYSPYRAIVTPLIEYIGVISHASSPDEKITVVLPQFITKDKSGQILHNHTSFLLRESLLRYDNIVVSTFPFHLNPGDDEE